MVIWLTIIGLITLLMFVKMKFCVDYSRLNDDDKLEVGVQFLKIFKLRYEIPYIDLFQKSKEFGIRFKKSEKEKEGGFIDFKSIIRGIKKFRRYYKKYKHALDQIILAIRKALVLKKINIKTEVGLLEPAVTGMLIGAVYAFVSNIFSYISFKMKVEEKSVSVKPNYAKDVIKVDLNCIFSIRVGNIIYVSFRISLLLFVILLHHLRDIIKRKVTLNLNINS